MKRCGPINLSDVKVAASITGVLQAVAKHLTS
jgi:hypothetical protein